MNLVVTPITPAITDPGTGNESTAQTDGSWYATWDVANTFPIPLPQRARVKAVCIHGKACNVSVAPPWR